MNVNECMNDLNENGILSTDFGKNTQMSNFMKIRPVGAELFHSDRRKDMTKLIVDFPLFSESS